MKNKKKPVWKPESEEVQTDQCNALDQMREKCPVAHSDLMGASLFRLVHWIQRNHDATFIRDRPALSEIAREFEALIDDLIESRTETGAKPEGDITASLMHEKVYGRPLSNEEIASILRNWTVGEIGTISSAVGILGHFIAIHPELQHQLRSDLSLIPEANEEILRLHGPLLANRRVITRPVEIAGQKLEAEKQLSFFWVSANRDPRVFVEPEKFKWGRDPGNNLLYGAGIHTCPGAPLARLELRVILEELLRHTNSINPAESKKPVNARYPASGFADLPLIIK